ncbi:hypothetical protein D3C86_1827080 [compost metagenome]
MPARTKLCFPAAARKMQTAAEHFMDVPDGERHVIEAALARWQLQQEEVVMASVGRATQERSPAGIPVGRHKPQLLRIEAFNGIHFRHEEHHVPHLDGDGPLV